MKHNVGRIDAGIRVIAAAILALLLAILVDQFSPVASLLVAVVGLVLLATGVTRACPLYALFGITTCKEKQPT